MKKRFKTCKYLYWEVKRKYHHMSPLFCKASDTSPPVTFSQIAVRKYHQCPLHLATRLASNIDESPQVS